MDLRLPPRHHVRRRDEADGTVQPYGIVVVHVLLNQAPRVLQRQRRSGPNALRFERFVPAFNFSVRLWIVGRRPDVGHARDTDEFFEVPRDELGTVSEMIRGRASGCFSLAPSRMISMSASFIASRRSQWTINRLQPSSTLHR